MLDRTHLAVLVGQLACYRPQRGFKNHDKEQNTDGGAAFPPNGTTYLNSARMEALETLRRTPSGLILQWLIRWVVERLARACGGVLVTVNAERRATLAWSAQRGLTER